MNETSPDVESNDSQHLNTDVYQAETHREKSDAQKQAAFSLSAIEPAPVNQSHISTQVARQSAEPKPNVIRRLWQADIESKSAAINTLMVILTFILALFAYKQWKVSADSVKVAQDGLRVAMDSLKVAQDTLKDVRDGAAASEERANRLTKANEDLAKAASLQAEGISRSVDIGKSAARATEVYANIASKSFLARERPQVFIQQANLAEALSIGKQPSLLLTILNSGPIEAKGFLDDATYTFEVSPFTFEFRLIGGA